MRREILTIGIVLILLCIVFIPCISSTTSENKKSDNKYFTKNDLDTTCLGTIYGNTHMSYCWSWCPVPFAIVTAGCRKTISTINGFYIISGLPLEKTYNLIGSKKGYHNDSEMITLTREEPVKKVLLDLQPIDDDIIDLKANNLTNNENENTGKIYGYTHCSHGVWTWDPIPYAWVRVGLRITRSDSRGYYELNNLPLDRKYRVIANRLGYLKTINKVTLTQEKPEVEQYIDMDWIIEYIFDFF